MELLGYIGYAVLLWFAVTWAWGVRVKLDVGTNTILGALFFVSSAVWLSTSNADKLHSLWLIPAGFIFAFFTVLLAIRTPPLFAPLRLIASLFAAIVRVGIPAERIRTEQEAGLRATVEEWASKHHEEK